MIEPRLQGCVRAAAAWCILVAALGTGARGGTTQTMEFDLGGNLRACLGEPVVVALSPPGEKRWGRHQFVNISEYPGGRILLRYHAADDAIHAYGVPAPTLISADQGKSWQPFRDEGLPPAGMTYPLLDGHFICLTVDKPLNASKLSMPKPVGSTFSYINYNWYRLDQCEKVVQDYMKSFDAVRWTPDTGKWAPERTEYDTSGALVWSATDTASSGLLARTWFERPPIRVDRELLFADYRSSFIQDDGSIPTKWGISCMVSRDNGRSWKRRSTIAMDREGTDSLSEPMLAATPGGELVCVIRCADQDQKPMRITYSRDRGHTWEPSVKMDQMGHFGVFPALVTLDCGVMVLSYGRPGIRLAFSTDGSGRRWSGPFTMIEGNPRETWQNTDGYTFLLPIGRDKLLLAYADFDHKDAQGVQHKAILVRPLTITGTPQ